MKQSDIYEKYTDFISDTQDVLIWEFDSMAIQKGYGVSTYSYPVEIQLFSALRKISESKNKSVREKKFNIFMGDFGSQYELYGVGITAKTSSRVTEIITGALEQVRGYQTMEYGRIPDVPFIPKYRYEDGLVIEYVYDAKFAGKLRRDDVALSGIKVMYRMWESAEGMGVRERFCSGGVL